MAVYEVKTPEEVKDYGMDWSGPLGGDQIQASSWEAVPDTLRLDIITPTFAERSSKVWLSDGESGTSYAITNTVTTRGGRTFQQSFYCDVI